MSGVKITRGPWALGPHLEGQALRSTGLVAQHGPRNFRGLNIEIEKDSDISTPGPTDSDECP